MTYWTKKYPVRGSLKNITWKEGLYLIFLCRNSVDFLSCHVQAFWHTDHFLNLPQTIPCFHVSAVLVLRKHCEKKEKLLLTSNFSLSHSIFYPFGELSANLPKFEIVVFEFGGVLNLSFGKGVTR